jgi:hypothetical protein
MGDAQQHWRRSEEGGFGFGAGEFRGQNRPYGALVTYSLNLPGLPVHDEDKERERKERDRKERAAAAATRTEKDGQKKDEEDDQKPQVEIQVQDAAGRLVRTFKAPARLGVNRAAWDLRRDAPRQAPRSADDPPPEEEPAGPEVMPGGYTVTVKYKAHQGSQAVRVLADPRSSNTEADWRTREEAIRRVQGLNDSAVDAMWRLRRARSDVEAVQEKVRQDAEARGEKDAKKIAETPLVKAGETVKEKLGELEKQLWQSPETPGILPDTNVWRAINYARNYVGSSWAPPSPTQLEHAKRAEGSLSAYLATVNTYFDTELAAYRKQALEAGVGLLAAFPPLTLKTAP